MTPPTVPELRIPAGGQFGYRAGFHRPRVLVEVRHERVVGAGLHLFVAPNGAGKTTLIRTLAGLNDPIRGAVTATGQIHYFSDELRADPELSARTFFRAWFKGEKLTLAENLAATLQLNLKTPIGKLSRGNRQKVLLILAETQIHQSAASLLLMDEPLSGLDRETRAQVAAIWAASRPSVLRLIIIHELESVHDADSLLTIAGGELRHSVAESGRSWLETYTSLQSAPASL